MKKTIKIFNDENVKLNIELVKVKNVSWYGMDASFKVDQIDNETGTVLASETYIIKNALPGIDDSDDIEIFFEEKELDGDDYDWEIPEEMQDEYNEWLYDRYTDAWLDCDDEEILSETHINELKKEIGFNKLLYYIDNNSVKFIEIKFNINGHMYIDDIERAYDLNTESRIFAYNGVYFEFYGYYDVYRMDKPDLYFNILKRTNKKKKVTKYMVENYGISALTYDLVGKYVYMYE